MRSKFMPSMLWALTTIPATSADAFSAALLAASPNRVSLSATRSDMPTRCANDTTGIKPLHHTSSGRRIPQKPFVGPVGNAPIWRVLLWADERETQRSQIATYSEGHLSAATCYRNQLHRWIQVEVDGRTLRGNSDCSGNASYNAYRYPIHLTQR